MPLLKVCRCSLFMALWRAVHGLETSRPGAAGGDIRPGLVFGLAVPDAVARGGGADDAGQIETSAIAGRASPRGTGSPPGAFARWACIC